MLSTQNLNHITEANSQSIQFKLNNFKIDLQCVSVTKPSRQHLTAPARDEMMTNQAETLPSSNERNATWASQLSTTVQTSG